MHEVHDNRFVHVAQCRAVEQATQDLLDVDPKYPSGQETIQLVPKRKVVDEHAVHYVMLTQAVQFSGQFTHTLLCSNCPTGQFEVHVLAADLIVFPLTRDALV